MSDHPKDIAALAGSAPDKVKKILDMLRVGAIYPPGDPENWFCIRGQSAVILTGVEVAAVLNSRVPTVSHPGGGDGNGGS